MIIIWGFEVALPKPIKTYEVALKEVDWLADKLGCPIDEMIKPLVAALRMYGVVTTQSCQGHSGRGIRWPWVQVEMASMPLASRLVCIASSARNQWVFEPGPYAMRLRPSTITGKLTHMQKQAQWLAKHIREVGI